MSSPSPSEAPRAAHEARAQLEKILGSAALGGSDQLKRLLRLVVERTLDGRAELLKEYNLGLEAFQRPPDYDPKVDPIVRVQARRLRSKLDEYYATEGAADSLVIRIPKGAYVPVFEPRRPETTTPFTSRAGAILRRRRAWAVAGVVLISGGLLIAWFLRQGVEASPDVDRSVAVLPLQMFTEGGNQSHIANQVAEVLTTELAKSSELRVVSRTTASRYRQTTSSLPEIARALQVRWVVEGGVGLEGNRTYVKLRAVDSSQDRKIWADVFDCDRSELVAVNRRAASRIAAAIAQELNSPRP